MLHDTHEYTMLQIILNRLLLRIYHEWIIYTLNTLHNTNEFTLDW